MALSRLQDDLLVEYKEYRRLINHQLSLFDPLAVTMRKPAAQRLLSKGVLIFFEILCYLLSLGSLVITGYIDDIYPFDVLENLRARSAEQTNVSDEQLYHLRIALIGIAVVFSVLFFILARVSRKIRLKNNILNLAGKNIKTLVGQHLQRKAAIDVIDQRHFQELPDLHSVPVSEIELPGSEG